MTARAKSAIPRVVVSAPYSEVHISVSNAGEHIEMRAQQLAAILRVIPVARYSAPMVQLASQLADDLVAAIKGGDREELLAIQLAELLLLIQGTEDAACDLLWLCHQLAREINVAMLSMCADRDAA